MNETITECGELFAALNLPQPFGQQRRKITCTRPKGHEGFCRTQITWLSKPKIIGGGHAEIVWADGEAR